MSSAGVRGVVPRDVGGDARATTRDRRRRRRRRRREPPSVVVSAVGGGAFIAPADTTRGAVHFLYTFIFHDERLTMMTLRLTGSERRRERGAATRRVSHRHHRDCTRGGARGARAEDGYG